MCMPFGNGGSGAADVPVLLNPSDDEQVLLIASGLESGDFAQGECHWHACSFSNTQISR